MADRQEERARKLLGFTYQEPQVIHQSSIPIPGEEKKTEPHEIELALYIPERTPVSYGEMLGNVLFSKVKSKRDWFRLTKEVEDSEYVSSITTTVSDDVLYRGFQEEDDGYFFKVEMASGVKEYEKDAQEFIEKLRIYEYFEDMLTYILLRGERFIKIDYQSKEIDELQEQDYRLSVFKRTNYVAEAFLKGNKPRFFDPNIFVPLRFKTFTYLTNLQTKDRSTQYYLKVGKSLLTEGTIEKLKALKIIESLIPLNEIVNIDRKLYFYFRVPPGVDVDSAFKQAREYERMLSGLLRMDMPNSVEELLDKVARVKVVPLFGEQKDVEAKEMPKPERMDSQQIHDIRRSIAATIGDIPAHALAVPIDGKEETSVRYLQMLKKIRKGLSDSVKWIIHSYLKVSKNVFVELDKIKVRFPKVPGAEELEVIDFMQMFTDQISSITRAIDEGQSMIRNAQNETKAADPKAIVDYLNDRMSQITGGRKIFRVPPEENIEEEI